MPAKKGHIPWNKGKKQVYDSETILKIKEARKKQNMGIWITNGFENKKHYTENNIPDGWRRGRSNLKMNSNGNNIITEQKYIQKYGELLGKEKWKLLNASKSSSLEKFCEKYGEKEGTIRWLNSIEKKKFAQTLEYFIQKYGSIEGPIKFQCYNKSKSSWNGNRALYKSASKESLQLFNLFKSILPKTLDFILFYQENLEDKVINEYFIFDDEKNRRFFYDLVCITKEKVICIEYNGIHVHPKSENDSNWKHAFTKQSAKECFIYDETKKQLFIKRFNIPVNYYTIWSDDCNKEDKIKEIVYENFKDS